MGIKLLSFVVSFATIGVAHADALEPRLFDLREPFVEAFRGDVRHAESRLEPANLYILGWSHESVLAYIVRGAPRDVNTFPNIYGPITWSIEPIDGWMLVIQDLVTDRVLWSFSIGEPIRHRPPEPDDAVTKSQTFMCVTQKLSSCEAHGLTRALGSCLECQFRRNTYDWPRTIDTFWDRGREFFRERLLPYSIVAHELSNLHVFPINRDAERINTELHVIPQVDVPFPKLRDVKLMVVSSHRGRKVVFHEVGRTIKGATAAAVLGYLRSPFEDRIAVLLGYIYGNQQSGYSGALRVVGVSLSSGFKQEAPAPAVE